MQDFRGQLGRLGTAEVEFLGPVTYAAASVSSLPESRTASLKTFVPSFNIPSVGGGERTRWPGRALDQGREGPLEANLSAGAVCPAHMQASAPAHSSLLPSAAASDCESGVVLGHVSVLVLAQGPSPLLVQIHF